MLTSKKSYCLVQKRPPKAWRMTRAESSLGGLRRAGSVEFVGLATPGLDRLSKARTDALLRRIGEAEPDRHRLAGTNIEAVVGGGLGADLRGLTASAVPVHDERVEGVFT